MVLGLLVLCLVSFTAGCGGGCGGSEDKTSAILEKLPANVDGVVVVDVKRTVTKGQIEAFVKLARDSQPEGLLPAWLSSVTHGVVVASWTADGGKEEAADCGAAADHVVALMSKEAYGEPMPEMYKDMRANMVKVCEASPRLAPCMMSLDKVEDLDLCVQPASLGKATMAVILTGDFKASDLLAATGTPQDGLLIGSSKAFTSLADNVVVLGQVEMVTAVKEAWDGKAARLGSDSEVMKLLSKVDKNAGIVVAGHTFTELKKGAPIEAMAMSVTLDTKSDVQFWMKADEATLEMAEGYLLKFKRSVGVVSADEFVSAFGVGAETAERMVATATSFAKSLYNTRADGGLMVSAEMQEGMAEYLTVMGPIAKAAFTKYLRRAKTAEAMEGIDKIYKGAASYFMTPRVSSDGTVLPCEFPKSIACTPTGSPCADGNTYPAAGPETWSDPTWSALSFAQVDKHRFQYCFESSGTGADATFTVTAHGDLDCDGVLSTFKRTGAGVIENGECSIKGGAFVKEKETE